MKKTMTAVLLAALMVFAATVSVGAYADEPGGVTFFVASNDIDGPVAQTLATTHRGLHGDLDFVREHAYRLDGQCVVAIGAGAEQVADVLADIADVHVAQGQDRYESAELAARAALVCES